MSQVLSIQSLSKFYGNKAAVKSIAFDVDAGQVFGVLGPNGSGKTTTLSIILGATIKDAGNFQWFESGSGAAERRRVGALLEQPCFYPWLSGEANLRVVAGVKKASVADIHTHLKTVGLWESRHQTFLTFSLGMKQRLGIAAVLLGKPEVLVLDEPTNGVDAQGIFDIRTIISNFAAAGGTVILASHMLDEVEKVCTHVAILKEGSVLKAGAIDDVLTTKGWTEISATDLDALERAVAEFEPGVRIQRQGQIIRVYGSEIPTDELNRQLVRAGIYVSRLIQVKASLESEYLTLVGREVNP